MDKCLTDVVIAGAGISGLACAYYIKQSGLKVKIIESSAQVGGKIISRSEQGYLWELGPNSLQAKDRTLWNLICELDLKNQVALSNENAQRRFIVRNGKLEPLGNNPLGFFASRVLSWSGKLRLLAEPFVARGKDQNESIYAFVSRRLGQEAADYLLEPFVRGIYAGDARKLLLRAAFPKLLEFEQSSGSIVKGALNAKKNKVKIADSKAKNSEPRSGLQLYSFAQGMQTLPFAIADKLKSELMLNSKLLAFNADAPHGFKVLVEEAGQKSEIYSQALIMTLPAHDTGEFLKHLSSSAAQALNAIDYPPLVIVVSAFPREKVAHALNGFGFLVPAVERRNILGSLWTSSFLAGRAVQDSVLITTMLGGAANRDVCSLSDHELLSLVNADLSSLIGAQGTPTFVRIQRWQQTIPQYDFAQQRALQEILQLEGAYPGLYLSGNYRGGISVGACVEQALQTSKKVCQDLLNRPQSGQALAAGQSTR